MLVAWILGATALAAASLVLWSLRWGIGPVPTSTRVRKHLLTLLPDVFEGTIYELGAGWGALALPLAKRYPKHTVVAYEISPLPYLVLSARSKCAALPNMRVYRKNFYKAPLADAGLVVCYLYPGAMERLKTKFEQELKPGTWVLTHTFGVPGWEPLAQAVADDIYHTPVYLYRV